MRRGSSSFETKRAKSVRSSQIVRFGPLDRLFEVVARNVAQQCQVRPTLDDRERLERFVTKQLFCLDFLFVSKILVNSQ